MSNHHMQHDFTELALLALQGDITPEQMEQFNRILASDPKKIRAYVDLMELCTELSPVGSVEISSQINDTTEGYDTLLRLLAEEEKTAQAIEIPKETPPRELIQKIVYQPQEKKKTNKFQLVTFITSIAAILFFVLFIKLVPQRPSSVEVATLVDQMNVQWSASGLQPRKGERLWSNDGPLELKKGSVELRYDEGVVVLIEGPAVFEIDRSRIFLDYGRLFSSVSELGLGFTVKTPTSQFVDMGTEFAVQADIDGSSELHVMKGNVQMFAGSSGKYRTGHMITENKAARYNANSNAVKDIPVNKTAFVRQINSKTGMIWRGQNSISLADIVGGGNGFGTGHIGRGISLTNGSCVSDFNWTDRKGNGKYLKVKELPFVDGVIVPDSEDGTLQVSSEGHIFTDCPNTSGLYYDEIRNGGSIHMTEPKGSFPMLFNNVQYGTAKRPLLFMHSNACITFDLDAIRKAMPGFQATSFQSRCVLIEKSDRIRTEKADVFVLVDGETQFKHIGFDQNGVAVNVDVPLTESDRFLTLAVTDGGDSIAIDWVGFVEPYILLETD